MATHSPDPTALAKELARFPIFQGLSLHELQLIDAQKPAPLRPGIVIFRQGDVIPRIFLILKGQIKLEREEEGRPVLRRIVRPGQVLGRLELDAEEGQLGTATTLSQVELIAVNLDSLARLRARYPHLSSRFDRSEVIGQLRANPYFAPLSDIEIKWISDIVEIGEVEAGTELIPQGKPAGGLIVVRQGSLRLAREDASRWVSAGSVVGFQSILAREGCRYQVSAQRRTRFFFLPKEDFLALVRVHPNHDWAVEPIPVETFLAKAELFSSLEPTIMTHLAGFAMQIHFHRAHRTVVQAGKEDKYYHILVRGSALRQSLDALGQLTPAVTIGPGTSFGTRSLLFGEPANETVETIEPTDWIRIHHDDFRIFLAEHPEVEDQLNLSETLRAMMARFKERETWQGDDEIVLFKARRHWIVLARRLGMTIGPLALIHLIIVLIYAFLAGHWPSFWWQMIIAAFYAIPLAAWIIVDYRNDYHIVTNKRIIHREKLIFIRDRTRSAPIDQIQNLNIHRNLLGQFLRYGDLVISTAATNGDIVFDFLPNPSEAHRIVSEQMQRVETFARVEDLEHRQKELQARLHLGLEERIDDRALLDPPPERPRRQPKGLPFLHLLGLQEEANHRLVWRRHWIGLLRITIPAMAVMLISGFVGITMGLGIFFESLPGSVRWFFIILAAMVFGVSMFWFWWNWEDWENDRYIVSDQIIERISKKPLWFDEERTTIGLERVQNVTFERPNPLAYFLDYGNVYIQTAAEQGLVPFKYVPAPADVQFEILSRMQNYQRNLERARLEREKEAFLEWLEAYHKLVAQEKAQHG